MCLQIANCKPIVVQHFRAAGILLYRSLLPFIDYLHCIVVAVTCKIKTKPSYLLWMDHPNTYSDVKVQSFIPQEEK